MIYILSSSSSSLGYNKAVMIFHATASDIVSEEKSLCTGEATVLVGPAVLPKAYVIAAMPFAPPLRSLI